MSCPLCEGDGGVVLMRTARWRLVRATEDENFPAFYRVIWNAHVREFSDLEAAERAECLDAVVAVEQVLRQRLQPTKVNLATLGNAVPHLHWHVVARFDWDSHFPTPVWGPKQRVAPAERLDAIRQRLPDLEQHLMAALRTVTGKYTDA